jgi:hypothetical protein
MCGKPEHVCEDFTVAGWYSTAGMGGPTKHCNKITGEKRYPQVYCSNSGESD